MLPRLAFETPKDYIARWLKFQHTPVVCATCGAQLLPYKHKPGPIPCPCGTTIDTGEQPGTGLHGCLPNDE